MKTIKSFIYIYLFLFLPYNLHYSQTFNGNLRFVKYSTAMGLSSNAQRCITQDKEGFIWVGTDDGLNRFDGNTFKVYRKNPDDPTSLKSNMINCLFTDSKGVLWVGTNGGGLSRYNKEKDNFYSYTIEINDTTALLNNDITTIGEDKNGKLWVGTSLGLHLFVPELDGFLRFVSTPQNLYNPKTVAQNHIKELLADKEYLWIAYTTGIITALNVKSQKFTHYKLFDVSSYHTADFSINSMVISGDKIWISTWSKGLWIFDKSSGSCVPYANESSKYINFVFKDDQNRIWYSPESQGIILIDGNNKLNYKYDDYDSYSLSSNSLADIFQDKQGNLWLASKRGDLNYLILSNPFHTWYKNPNSIHGLSNNLVTAIIEDSKKRIWVGYQDGGIDILDAENKRNRIHINGDNSTGLGPGTVTHFYESKNGTIWVGKYLDGLKRFDESRRVFVSYQHVELNDETIGGNDIRHITEDNNGNLWLAVHGGGVDKFNPATGKFTHFKKDENSPSATIISDWTYTVVSDKENNIWVGTIAGVSVLSEKSGIVRHYMVNAKDGYNLSNPLAKVIYPYSKDIIWIGTNDGLNKLNLRTNKIKKYFAVNGLPNNVIMDILEDNNHDLWISTSKGLSKFSPEKESFKNYSVQDGLVTDEFNVFTSSMNTAGEMYFGGREGFNRFHPNKIKINYFKPPVYITDLKLFNQSVSVENENITQTYALPNQISYCKEIELDYHQNVITLEFVALNFLNLEKNQYRYKLEGFEQDWTPAGYKREVTYTNLHPGEYTFRVIASNNDGIWNTQGAALKIIVNPPIWRTNWAYAFYILFIILLLYIFRKLILHNAEQKRKLELEELEIHKLQEMDALKMQFFSNISHEFRTPLALIIGPIEKLLQTAKDKKQQLELSLVHRNANRLLKLINQLMDFRKIEEDKLELNLTHGDIAAFIKETVEAFDQDAKQRNISLTYKSSHKSAEIYFDTDKLDKIIYNLLSNAIKYTSDNGCVDVALSLDENEKNNFTISVKDTGIGIPKEDQSRIFDRFYQVKNKITTLGSGIGLSLVSELVKLHKGKIIVESEQGKGSEFIVTLPLWTEETELPQQVLLKQKAESNKSEEIIAVETQDSPKEKVKTSDHLPRLLIIEDNADMRLFIKSEFMDNYNVCEAPNGLIGLEKAFDEIPDIIICDVMMPGMDGYEVCKTLKHDERTSHIPIVILTAKSSEQHTIEGFESGADDYISKPLSPAVLRVRIKNLIESRKLLQKKFVKEPFATIKEISPSKTDEKLFNKAYSIVENNLNNPSFEVNDFASQLGMSRTQLYRKINAISGQSVKEFIRIIRLKKAAEMLIAHEMNISEVAYSVGFNSLSYFTTSFTEYFGMNPTKYIEKYTKK